MTREIVTQTQQTSTTHPLSSGILQRQCTSCGQHTFTGGECEDCQKKRSTIQHPVRGRLQTKLRVNQPGDQYEQEADLIAEQIVHMPAPHLQRQLPTKETEQRSPAKPLIQRRITQGVTFSEQEVTPIANEVLQSSGQPLDSATRRFMEPRFGYDFSHVRVHSDVKASNMAKSLNARAFTMGRNIVFAAGEYTAHSIKGKRLIAHELSHVVQQDSAARLTGTTQSFLSAPPQYLQRDIGENQLSNTPVEQIMGDENYFENGIQRIEFFSAELAILHYADGSQIRLGLVPEYIDSPFEAVDYRTLRSSHIPVSSTPPSLGQGSIRFVPRGVEGRVPPGFTLQNVIQQFGRTIRFTHHPNGRIVPTEVNSISAPRLSQALRDAEAEYVRQFDAMARGMVQVLRRLEWIIILSSLLGGLGTAGSRAGAGRASVGRAGATAATGAAGRAQSILVSFLTRLLRSGASESITVEGVGFGSVRAAMRGTELLVSRNTIVNAARIQSQGRLIHGAFEQAAIQVARQAGARTARVALETVVNPKWAAYLESQGYAFNVIANELGGFSRVLTKVFTL